MVRNAQAADAPALAAIYNHYVLNSTITFEETAVPSDEMARRVDSVQAAGLPWLVYEIDGSAVGYAYATKWRERSAYRFSVESTVYVRHDRHGHGIARQLYAQLLAALHANGVHVVIGGIAQPNTASVALHEAMGFERVALFREVGRKFDRWVDVGYWQKLLVG
ncbi:arsinothricin resistance N-acetyltransferase ArsN1 family B [Massilia endophytica]|uniref:arsinothricin resistance N-acetyltransferase ArsN1 family B n=1 Tax=Massilia endophytica TaxID=2899220 RepID=UPI001E4AD2EC|nr:arsinothricin resistance N-acetyltransferase ArsN1 family B [Massilia endophytica]UGQ46949.1 N-acetyltransferase family protein [Massilia endophytica]